MTDDKTPAVEPVETPADVIETAVAEDAAVAAKGGIGWLSLTIAGLFGLVYAYFVYQAIGNIIELPKSYDALSLSDSVPWLLLVIGLLIPIAVYVLAFVIGLRRSVLDKAVIFVMGIAVTAGLSYTVVAIHRLTFNALVAAIAG